MEVRWLVSVTASYLYAAGQVLRGRHLVDAKLAEKLAEPVDQLQKTCEACQVDPILLLDHLAAVSIEESSLDHRITLAIRKAAGESNVTRLAAAVLSWAQQMQSLFTEIYPNLLEELELRSVPLREQWEARGPGLIAQLRKLLGPQALVENAEVILVQPVTGGGGVAHVPYNRVCFEAVLANPAGDLPEVVRLGWLLAQLQLDLPIIQGNLSRQRTLEVGAIALVPASLAAAHEVELTGPLDGVLARALTLWTLSDVDADELLAWWETYVSDRPAWSMALAALDQFLNVAAD